MQMERKHTLSEQEILKKAIEKAVKNRYWDNWKVYTKDDQRVIIESNIKGKEYYSLIFSHDFAEAFWGECNKWLDVQDGEGIQHIEGKENYDKIQREIKTDLQTSWRQLEERDGWHWHLQQMVLEKEPLQYIKKFL